MTPSRPLSSGAADSPVGRVIRRIELVRACWGALLTVNPRVVVADTLHARDDQRADTIARVLGLRHLAQAALSGLHPSSDVLAMGVWVDATHAATAVGLGVVDRARTRAALADAAVALGWAWLGYRDLAPGGAPDRREGRPQVRRDRLARAVLLVVPGGRHLLRRAHDR